jgi:hypothetical protein
MSKSKTKPEHTEAGERREGPLLKDLLLAPEPRWDMPLPKRKLRRREPPDFTDEIDANPSKR